MELESYLNDVDDPSVDIFFNSANGEIENLKTTNANVTYLLDVPKANPKTGTIDGFEVAGSQYGYETLYKTTFYEDRSPISNAVRFSSSYQDLVKDNQVIKNSLGTRIFNNIQDNNGKFLGLSTIYIGNDLRPGIFGNGNDFNYFDQSKIVSNTLDVLVLALEVKAAYSKLEPSRNTPDYPKNLVIYQNARNSFEQSINNLDSLYDKYFGTSKSAELALLMGRTSVNNRRARVKNVTLSPFDCTTQNIFYTAEIDFFIFDGTTFNADDAYKDELARIASFIGTGALPLGNFLAAPFTGIDIFSRKELQKLLKVGPALGLGWDIQQFGYGRPHFNLIEVKDTIAGFVDNPNYHPDCNNHNNNNNNNNNNDSQTTLGVNSLDPNDILGPEGFGEENWISAEETFDYTIRFENDPELATAPAQIVKITQKLDSDLDFRTFRVGDFGFGDTFIDVPENRAFYQTRLDLVAEKGIYVDVVASIDIATGEAFWELRSIDPDTGELPVNPLLGFLPPNLTKPEGDGFVSYSIRPHSDIATGDVIDAQATIIFDINEPIDTPPIFNSIDIGKPISTVNELPPISESEEFIVSWFGSDDENGSAIADYTIYVAENAGEFTPWLTDTTLTEALFIGTAGNSYEFYSVARDNAGNVQDIPTTAQAVITIAGGNNPPIAIDDRFTANASNAKVITIDSLLNNAHRRCAFGERDPENTPLTLITVDNAINGIVSRKNDDIIFTPDGISTSGSFEYTVSDGVFTSTATVTIDIGTTEKGSNNNDTFVGRSGDDHYRGRKGDDHISGLAGNDILKGQSGNDTLIGGVSNDILDGGSGNDLLEGGLGNDTLIGSYGLDTLDGGEDSDIYQPRHNKIHLYSDAGSTGTDTIQASETDDFKLKLSRSFDEQNGIEVIDGSLIAGEFKIVADFNFENNVWDFSGIELVNVDLINGRNGNDEIMGSTADDFIQGKSGNDTLIGGVGNDVLDGGSGNDSLEGGLGNDTLTGGRNLDSFIFNRLDQGIDTITDFSVKDDVLVFSASGFAGDLLEGEVANEMFILGSTVTTPEQRFIYDKTNGNFFYDSDGIGDNPQIQLAQLDSGLNLSNDNLFVEI